VVRCPLKIPRCLGHHPAYPAANARKMLDRLCAVSEIGGGCVQVCLATWKRLDSRNAAHNPNLNLIFNGNQSHNLCCPGLRILSRPWPLSKRLVICQEQPVESHYHNLEHSLKSPVEILKN
jgi:hypothetical protein